MGEDASRRGPFGGALPPSPPQGVDPSVHNTPCPLDDDPFGEDLRSAPRLAPPTDAYLLPTGDSVCPASVPRSSRATSLGGLLPLMPTPAECRAAELERMLRVAEGEMSYLKARHFRLKSEAANARFSSEAEATARQRESIRRSYTPSGCSPVYAPSHSREAPAPSRSLSPSRPGNACPTTNPGGQQIQHVMPPALLYAEERPQREHAQEKLPEEESRSQGYRLRGPACLQALDANTLHQPRTKQRGQVLRLGGKEVRE